MTFFEPKEPFFGKKKPAAWFATKKARDLQSKHSTRAQKSSAGRTLNQRKK